MTLIAAQLRDASDEARRRREHEQATRAEERALHELRTFQQQARNLCRSTIAVDVPEQNWTRLAVPEGYVANTVYAVFDDDDTLAIAYRYRPLSDGGAMLTVLAAADIDGDREWVASQMPLLHLADLSILIDDARERATDYAVGVVDPIAGMEIEGVEAEIVEPRFSVTITADTEHELLSRLVSEMVGIASFGIATQDAPQP